MGRKRGKKREYGVQSVEREYPSRSIARKVDAASFYGMIVSGVVVASLSLAHAALKVRWYREHAALSFKSALVIY